MSSLIAFAVGVLMLITAMMWTTSPSYHEVLVSGDRLRITVSLLMVMVMVLFGVAAIATAF